MYSQSGHWDIGKYTFVWVHFLRILVFFFLSLSNSFDKQRGGPTSSHYFTVLFQTTPLFLNSAHSA